MISLKFIVFTILNLPKKTIREQLNGSWNIQGIALIRAVLFEQGLFGEKAIRCSKNFRTLMLVGPKRKIGKVYFSFFEHLLNTSVNFWTEKRIVLMKIHKKIVSMYSETEFYGIGNKLMRFFDCNRSYCILQSRFFSLLS